MKILDHLAQAAAVLLLVELLVVLIIFLAISGGLAWGLHWGRGKTGGLFEKVNGYLPRVQGYVHTGTDYAAKPFITLGGVTAQVKATAAAVQSRVREIRERQNRPQAPAPQPPEEQKIEPVTTV